MSNRRSTRCNFLLDAKTISLLEQLANDRFRGNKSEAVRAAIQGLAAAASASGWVISGFTPVTIESETACHCCSKVFEPGDSLYRPVFQWGSSPNALEDLPESLWLDCSTCAKGHLN
jgi:hypothetical protein